MARHGKHLKTLAKHATERAFVLVGIPLVNRALHRNDTIVLAYHNVVSDGESSVGDSSLHLPRSRFVAQIEALARTHEVMPLTDLLNERYGQRSRAAITFDDAYVGALEHAIPELARRGIPATVFVAPGLLGTVTWWDVTAVHGAVPPRVRDRALREFAGNGEAILASPEFSRGRDTLGRSMRIGTEGELRSAVQNAGIQLGSHTWAHPNLATLTSDAVERELTTSRDWLRTNFPSAFVPWLSYPYGLSSPAVQSSAARAGYAGALRVDGGWCTASSLAHTFDLPRLNVPAGLSLPGFRLRTGC
jgi:peptidoglycan/xylan/chitin deacetylase (PgdA/CDA1 family)